MATHVQLKTGTLTSAQSTTVANTFSSATTAGNAIIAVVTFGLSNPTSITATDTAGNTYTLQVKAYNSTDSQGYAILTAFNITGNASNTVTVTFGENHSWRGLTLHEVSGLATSSVIDGTPVGAVGNTTTPSSGSVTTSVSGDYIFGVLGNPGGSNSVTITEATGFTGWDTTEWSTSTANGLRTADETQSSAGSVSYAPTLSATAQWVALEMAAKQASGSHPAVTATDTLSESDSPARLTAHPRSVSDSVSFSGTATQNVTSSRSITDSVSFSESTTVNVVSQNAAFFPNYYQANEQPPNAESSGHAVLSLTAADNFTFSDSVVTGLRGSIFVTDTFTTSDSARQNVAPQRTAGDTFTTVDNPKVTVTGSGSSGGVATSVIGPYTGLAIPNQMYPNGHPPAAVSAATTQLLASTTTLSANPNSISYGSSVTLTATVTSGATGSVSFYDGITLLGIGTLSSGSCSVSTTALSAGARSVTAVYSGDGKYAGSTSDPVTVTVTVLSSSTTLTVSPTTATENEVVTLTATINSSTASGYISFYSDSTLLGQPIVNSGISVLKTTAIPVGSHNITATYSGDTNHNGSTSNSVPLTITALTLALKISASRAGTTADYQRYVSTKPVKTDRINEPDYLDLEMVPFDSNFVTLRRGDYITVNTQTYGIWFTGYVTNDAQLERLGTNSGQTVWGYKYQLTSDEYILNLKPLGIMAPFLNKTMGEILQELVTTLAPWSNFDLSHIHDGLTLARYIPDPTKHFSDVVQEFCDAAGYRWQARSNQLFFEQMDTRTAALVIDGNDKHFTPSNFSLTPAQDPIINDMIVLGDIEPQDYVTEYFVSDGVTTKFPLVSSVFGVDSSVLIDDTFQDSAINTDNWTLFDDPQNYIQLYNGYVNALGGPNDNSYSVYMESAALIPLEGVIKATHGEWDFVSPSDGVIASFWSNTPDTLLKNCVYGIKVSKNSSGGTVLNPIVMGQIDGSQSYTIKAADHGNYTYIIRTMMYFQAWARFRQGFSYMDSAGNIHNLGGDGVQDLVTFQTLITVLNNNPDTLTSSSQAVIGQYSWLNSNAQVPSTVLYAYYNPIVLNDLHVTFSKTTIETPMQAQLAVLPKVGFGAGYGTWQPEVIGFNSLDSFDDWTPAATITDANNGASTRSSKLGKPQWNPGQAALQYIVDPVSAKADLPIAGSLIRTSYRRSAAAMGRVQDKASVTTEATEWGDNGLRSDTRLNVTPKPRTSAECELAAQALVSDLGRQHWDGTYTCTSLFSVTGEPLSGTILKFQHLPSDMSSLTAESIQEVKTTLLCSQPEEIFQHEIKFGRKDNSKKLLAQFTKQTDTFLPQDTAETPNAIDINSVGLVFADDVKAPYLVNWTSTYLVLNTGQAPPVGGGFEIRYTDSNWGADDGRNLVVRSPNSQFTVARNLRGKVVFVKAYDVRNYLLFSEDLTNPAWIGSSGTTAVRNTQMDINGNYAMVSTMSFPASGSVTQTTTVDSLSTLAVFSVDLNGTGSVTISVEDSVMGTVLATQTVTLPKNWTRTSLSVTPTAGLSGKFRVRIANASSSQSLTVMVHRASFELSTSIETLYCKTNAIPYGALSRYPASVHVAFPLAPPTPIATVDMTNLIQPTLSIPTDKGVGSGAVVDIWGFEVRSSDNASVIAHYDLTDPNIQTQLKLPYNTSRNVTYYVYFYNLLHEYGTPQVLTASVPLPQVLNLEVDDSQKKVIWQGINCDSYLIELSADAAQQQIITTHVVTDQFFQLGDTDFFNLRYITVTPYDALGAGQPEQISHQYIPAPVFAFQPTTQYFDTGGSPPPTTHITVVVPPPSPSTDPTPPPTIPPQHHAVYIRESWNNYRVNGGSRRLIE